MFIKTTLLKWEISFRAVSWWIRHSASHNPPGMTFPFTQGCKQPYVVITSDMMASQTFSPGEWVMDIHGEWYASIKVKSMQHIKYCTSLLTNGVTGWMHLLFLWRVRTQTPGELTLEAGFDVVMWCSLDVHREGRWHRIKTSIRKMSSNMSNMALQSILKDHAVVWYFFLFCLCKC